MAGTQDVRIQKFGVSFEKGTPELEKLLARISKDTIADRNRTVGDILYRLDNVRHESKEDIWLLNFVRSRPGHGPGKFAEATEMAGFAFAADESFGEDAAALYAPAKKVMLIQYSHLGMRHSKIEQYLSGYTADPHVYRIKPKLQLNMEREFQKTEVIRRLELGFDLTKMTAADRKAGESLSSMTAIGSDLDADKLYITLSISQRDPTKRLSMDKIKKAVTSFLPMAGHDALIKANAYGGDEPKQKAVPKGRKKPAKPKYERADFETIDLLDAIVETEIPVVVGADHRMSLDSRYSALKTALTKL